VILLRSKAGLLQDQHGEGEEAREESTSKIREEGLGRPNSKNNPLEEGAGRPVLGPPFRRCAVHFFVKYTYFTKRIVQVSSCLLCEVASCFKGACIWLVK